MRDILQSVLRFVIRHVLSLFLVVAIMLAGKWAYSEWHHWRSSVAALPALEQVAQEVATHRAGLSERLSAQVERARAMPDGMVDTRIETINLSIAAKSREPPEPMYVFPRPLGEDLRRGMVAHFKRGIDVELLTQERDYLKKLRSFRGDIRSRKTAEMELERLRIAHLSAYAALKQNARQLALLQQPDWRTHLFDHLQWTIERAILNSERTKLLSDNLRAYQAFSAQNAIVRKIAGPNSLAPFRVDEVRIAAVLKPLRDRIGEVNALLAHSWIARLSEPVMDVLPAAALVVVSACLVPFGIKLVFYFVLAPVAARQRTISIDKSASGEVGTAGFGQPGADAAGVSSVARTVTIGKDDILLIKPEYLQSSGTGSRKDTQLLLDWSCPFTSLAAGLFAMTRIRAQQAGSVVISATQDPLSEVALLSVPPGAALVFQPRALAGVLYRTDSPLVISRHWRLGSVHAWLTLQLRYLVFRGPVTLIVKGCRGVKLEAGGSGRSISQSATLGFSANIAYSTIRSETFLPYLMGKQALFHDHFQGESSFYVYEETPRGGKKSGSLERGFEAMTDAVLKVFGI
jgi:hypothetical protein